MRAVIGFMVAALMVGACGSTPAPTPIGVCGLVPNMDEIVGKTAAGPPGGFTLNDFDRCIWTYATDPSRSVGVAVGPSRGHSGAIDNFGAGETVLGLGDDARWWEGNRLLSVALGQRVLQVDLHLDDPENTRDLAVSIAQAALENLN